MSFHSNNSRRLLTLHILALSICAGGARAAEFDYGVDAGVGRSDNITRAPSNEIEEDIATAGLQFSLNQASSRLRADAIGNLAYFDYLDDTYDSELAGNFAGQARLDFIPERFSWMVADNFGQVLNDPFQPATPDNRENINYLTTGPDLTFALGAQTRLRFGGRYALTTYEDSPIDSNSMLGEVELGRLLSGASTISLNARMQKVEYDESSLDADYDQSEAFVRYMVTGTRTQLSVDAGYTSLDRDADAGSDSGLLARVDATRRVSAASTLSLGFGTEFSSAGAAFASTQGSVGVDLGATPGRQVVDPFTRDYLTLGWDYSRNRTTVGMHGSWNKQTYDNRPEQDQTLTAARFSVGREMSAVTNLELYGTYGKGSFEQAEVDYDELGLGLNFSWRFSRMFSLNLTYDRFDRDSDAVLGDYTENRYWLSITYGRGEPRDRMLGPSFAVDAASPGT